MTRIWLALCAITGLAACGATEPPNQGVGFNSYEPYRYDAEDARRAQLQTPLELAPENTGAPSPAPHGRVAVTPEELAAAGIDISPDVRVRRPNGQVLFGPATDRGPLPVSKPPSTVDPRPATGVKVASAPVAPTAAPAIQVASAAPVGAPLSALRPGAVTNQEYVATAQTVGASSGTGVAYAQANQNVPERPASTGPDIVAYALSTQHSLGTKQFRRTFASEAKSRRSCNRYTGSDQAQRAFLEAGGPQRDRLGLDPDGDGFACSWSPEPFRVARSG